MTNLFRMSIALVFQAIAMTLRSVLFFLLALLQPLDVIADWLQRVSLWLAIDNEMVLFGGPNYRRKREEESNDRPVE